MPENPAADKQQVLQIIDRLQAKLREKRDVQHNENLSVLRNTLRSPLFNQILTLQQSIKQLKDQLNYMPPDRSVDFDFTKRGLLVFADKSVTAGNVCKQSSLPEPRASTFIPNLGVNEFNAIIQQMAKVDGVNIQDFTNQEVVEALRNTGQTVRLTLLRRRPSVVSSERCSDKVQQSVPALASPGALGTEASMDSRNEENQKQKNNFQNEKKQILHKSGRVPFPPAYDLKSKWENLLGPEYEVMVVNVDMPITDDSELQKYSKVNGVQLYGKSRREAITFLKEVPPPFTMVCCRRLFDDGSESLVDEPTVRVPSPEQKVKPEENINPEEEEGELALWSPDVKIIELEKDKNGLGFSILDYQDPLDPTRTAIVISSLVAGGVAERGGELLPGDRLVFVNEKYLDSTTLTEAVEVLKSVPPGRVSLGICKPLVGESKEEEENTHGMDTSNMKTSPGSPEPRDNTNFSIILEAPQGFRDETPFKEEAVDEPILDLGRSFQLSQNDNGYEKESWEMREFWKPTTEEVDEEREMLVDDMKKMLV